MELQDNISLKYHLRVHKSTDTYPNHLDIEMDILFLLLDHNKQKRRKKIKGDLPVSMFQGYYTDMDEYHQPQVLDVFAKLKGEGHLDVSEDVIEVSPKFIKKYVKI